MSGTYGPNEQLLARALVRYVNKFQVEGKEPEYDTRYDFEAVRKDMKNNPDNTFEFLSGDNIHKTAKKINVKAMPEVLSIAITSALSGTLAASSAAALKAIIKEKIESGTQLITVLDYEKMTQNISIIFEPEPFYNDKFGTVAVYFSSLELFTDNTNGAIFEALTNSFQALEFRYNYMLLAAFSAPPAENITATMTVEKSDNIAVNLKYMGPYTKMETEAREQGHRPTK
jgi:hypothetical protein